LTLDLEAGVDPRHALKLLFCLFHRAAFLPQSWDEPGRSFQEFALAEARHYEEKVSQDLGERVFTTVFPDLANALVAHDPAAPRPFPRNYLDQVRESALILLYRVLFVLYAEDRFLLPARDKRYYEYSLKKLRAEVHEKRDAGMAFSNTAARLWDDLKSLFASIASGDAAIGLPAYNGGLFENHQARLLDRVRVPDERMAPIIDQLSRRGEDVLRYWVNYRDLSVQHLGSIYERLLEYRLEEEGDKLIARPTSFARRTTGSFYTHDDLVKLIIVEAIGPLITEKREAFFKQLAAWHSRRELKPADWEMLDALDPASRMLDLRVCDPAMGSGHFLVSLVDYMADSILEVIEEAADAVARDPWAKRITNPWRSPLVFRISEVRARIMASALAHGWSVDATQLDDRHIVRRMILKRVIHGVDKNPMAVELAKVALWLHTFTVGAPLSFLDHHLRCGDALHGEWPQSVTAGLQELGVSFLAGEQSRIEGARRGIETISDLTDIDIAEAHRSKELLDEITAQLAPFAQSLDLWRAIRWLAPGWPARRALTRSEWAPAFAELLSGRVDWRDWAAAPSTDRNLNELLGRAQALIARERFLHWPLAFPHIWANSKRAGFDAVIGNPPWDRIKLQEVAARAADRKRMIEALKENADPLYREYFDAADTAETAARVFRECGDYPVLSGGDVNLYSLFVERGKA
jgi:hypothetical protein